MRKDEYLRELRGRLHGFEEAEIADALAYCEEYFDEAGEGHEEEVIADLGSPAKFAAQLRAERTIRREYNEPRQPRSQSGLKNTLIVILGIFALPIALPLLLALVCVVFALVVTILALAFAGVVSFGAIWIAGIPLIINGFMNLNSAGNGWIALGGGLLAMGIGTLLCIAFFSLIRYVLPAFQHALSRIYHKAKGGKQHEKA